VRRIKLIRWFCLLALSSLAESQQVIKIDGSKTGRSFEGLGALSAGASSRLLLDYPEPYRSRILDLLFKPHFGAGLQHLKVEIGGDVNSTCGTEPSHAHTRAEFLHPQFEFFNRGYEWFLLKEAKKRNPSIFLDALEWGAPYWIGNGQFYSQDNADYIAAFLKAARQYHNVDIDYVGIWNETPYDISWIKRLRQTLDRQKLDNVKIVAADQSPGQWRIAQDVAQDAELDRAIYALGDHYLRYRSTEQAKASGKPLWANEEGPWRGDWIGATKLAKLFNRDYIEGRMTKTIVWSLITSYYDNLPLPGSGLMRANEPWSGHFEIQPALWIVAHTTQFAAPGWYYLDGGCGYLPEFGSYVTLRNPRHPDEFSMIIETMDAPYTSKHTTGQRITFQFSPEFPDKELYVWRSNEDEQFILIDTVKTINRSIALSLEGESVYTLTTTTGQKKGLPASPPATPFPFPYADDFETYDRQQLPRYFMDQAGVFETAERPDHRGQCLQQVVPQKGIEWHYHWNPLPETVIGSEKWTDYMVSCEALIRDGEMVSLFGRITKLLQNADPPLGYGLQVHANGDWSLNAYKTTVAHGRGKPIANKWHKIALSFAGANIRILIDDELMQEITHSQYARGMAGLGCGWHTACFDNFCVGPVQ
jgi:galactosylceramidase